MLGIKQDQEALEHSGVSFSNTNHMQTDYYGRCSVMSIWEEIDKNQHSCQ